MTSDPPRGTDDHHAHLHAHLVECLLAAVCPNDASDWRWANLSASGRDVGWRFNARAEDDDTPFAALRIWHHPGVDAGPTLEWPEEGSVVSPPEYERVALLGGVPSLAAGRIRLCRGFPPRVDALWRCERVSSRVPPRRAI